MSNRDLKKTYLRVPPTQSQPTRLQKLLRQLVGCILSPPYWLLAHRYRTPGLQMHLLCARLGLRLLFRPQAPISPGWSYQFIFSPMDSTRYFEFDFAWRALANVPIQHYLDVSSPRLFPLILLSKKRAMTADLINPDSNDLNTTINLVRASGFDARCRWHDCLIESAPFAPGSFDAITSISVVEHIPNSMQAVDKMWELLKPGGRLLLTLPCAAEALVQYINRNEYGIQAPDENGFVFFQYIYDMALLSGQIFCVTGQPARYAIYGEKKAGGLQKNAEQKRTELLTRYPFWREPYMMGQEYTFFKTVTALPGEGVIAMEFVKS